MAGRPDAAASGQFASFLGGPAAPVLLDLRRMMALSCVGGPIDLASVPSRLCNTLAISPLYVLRAVVGATGGRFSPAAALGSLSLIFWALIITISVKYCLFVMRADNHGEGGILALMSMTGANWSEGRRILIVMGLFGAALIYGDGIITPAISVLSALEGLNVATDVF